MTALELAFKMASVTEVRSKQRAVIEFLLAENQCITYIHRRLQNVYGDLALDKSTVSRWARRLSSSQGRADLSDLPRVGRPHTAVTPAMLECTDTIIRGDRRITIKHLAALLDVGSADKLVHQLEYSKVCFRWVRRHKNANELLILHDDARPHTSLRTRQELTNLQLTVLPHPPYSTDLAPSDFHLFGPMKDALLGKPTWMMGEVIDEAKR